MKKKNIVISIILALTLAMSVFAFAGCGDNSYGGSVKVEGTQNTSYAVHSNGGNAVQYGNYIYFINGSASYEDTDGKNNVWGDVVKGALYRAELVGDKNGAEFDVKGSVSEVTNEYVEFKTSAGVDYDDNPIDVANVQLIAPKIIGTSGYSSGGIFIYDNYVYYATPNNVRNKAGEYQYKKTDFLRTSLDGKVTQKLYTSENDTDTSPYAFYKQGDKVYLVLLDGTTLKSISVNDKKVIETLKIAEDVTSATLPTKSDYYANDNSSVSVEDFVFFTRSATDEDGQRSGTVLEYIRPDGSERTVFLNNGQTSSIEAVRDGVVFYRTTENGNTVINFTNLHDSFMGEAGKDTTDPNSPTYKAYEDSLPADKRRTNVRGTALNVGNLSSYTYTYAFRPSSDIDPNVDTVYVLASTGSAMHLFGNDGTSKTVYSSSATIETVIDGYAYYRNSTNFIQRLNIFEENAEPQEVSDRAGITNGLPVDVVAGYVMYFGIIDDWASGYAVFNKLPGEGIEGSKAMFVGKRAEDDEKPEDDEDEETTDEESAE